MLSTKEFFLLERTDDNTISDVTANQIYTGALSNDGETLELRDDSNTIVDEVPCLSGWFAGESKPKRISMERIDSEVSGSEESNWRTTVNETMNGLDANGNPILGTPQNNDYEPSEESEQEDEEDEQNDTTTEDDTVTNDNTDEEDTTADTISNPKKDSSSTSNSEDKITGKTVYTNEKKPSMNKIMLIFLVVLVIVIIVLVVAFFV